MCGITGILNTSHRPVPGKLIDDMNQAIAHRGPDGDGVWVDGHVGLGHRRLAIIDLSSHGHQPMMSYDKRYIITYNGEVYNFRELRIELEQLGYGFHSQTDTEVIVNAFSAWGCDAILKFNGMFSFAIWDKYEQELTLVRDRYGIKPLYFAKVGDEFIFSSEIKAILKHPAISVNIDPYALKEYMTFQNILSHRTLFSNIHILEPGHFLKLKDGNLNFKKYWDFCFEESFLSASREELSEELSRLFFQAVSRQLISDVEVGSYLSGGTDSATITAIASAQLPYIKTFTCGFDVSSVSGLEQAFDERKEAEHMSYLFKTEHYEMVLKAGDMERCMSKLAYAIEEPRVGQCYPNYYVSRLASKFGKVVLSGTAGDEIFAGYPWRYYPHVTCTNEQAFNKSYFKSWERIFKEEEHSRSLSPIWNSVSDYSVYDVFADKFSSLAYKSELQPEDCVNRSLYFEAKTFLHGLLLIEDKLSMSHGLETRVPFLDNDLVDFAMKLPVNYKLGCLKEVVRNHGNQQCIDSYLKKSKDGKLILRDVMKRYVPASIADKVKQGFSAPDASWFKGESMDYVKRTILNDNARIYEYMDQDFIRQKVSEHLSGQSNNRLMIWSLLSIEKWCQTFHN